MMDSVRAHVGLHSFVVGLVTDVVPYGHFVASGTAIGAGVPLEVQHEMDEVETLSVLEMEPFRIALCTLDEY